MAYVYAHIRVDNGEVFYIGIGTGQKYKRAYYKFGRNRFWNFIVKKYEYKVEILFDDVSNDYAFEKETELIKLYGRSNLNKGTLCNLTDGGDGARCVVISSETRIKISQALKGKPVSIETRNKLSKANTGKVRSVECRTNASNKRLGIKYPSERNKKISDTLKRKYKTGERTSAIFDKSKCKRKTNPNYKHTDETKKRMSILAMGNKKGLGKICSEIKKSKIGLSNKKGFLIKKIIILNNKIFYISQSFEKTIADLTAQLASGATPAQLQTIIDSVTAAKSDLESTPLA